MNIKVFWLERTGRVQVRLRVYRYQEGKPCIASSSLVSSCEAIHEIHANAARSAWIEELPDNCHRTREDLIGEDDPRWPRACDQCGIPLARGAEGTHFQVWAEPLYVGAPDQQLYTLRDAPVGAMWNAEWLADRAGAAYTGPDGLSLHVRTPGGDWCVDSQASNCDRPQEVDVPGKPGWKRFERSHHCWVRHGDPRTGELHVDKNGVTCGAGAGSIIVGNYHGFLHNGYLTEC